MNAKAGRLVGLWVVAVAVAVPERFARIRGRMTTVAEKRTRTVMSRSQMGIR